MAKDTIKIFHISKIIQIVLINHALKVSLKIPHRFGKSHKHINISFCKVV